MDSFPASQKFLTDLKQKLEMKEYGSVTIESNQIVLPNRKRIRLGDIITPFFRDNRLSIKIENRFSFKESMDIVNFRWYDRYHYQFIPKSQLYGSLSRICMRMIRHITAEVELETILELHCDIDLTELEFSNVHTFFLIRKISQEFAKIDFLLDWHLPDDLFQYDKNWINPGHRRLLS